MHTKYFHLSEEVTCNAIIGGKNFFDQPVKNDIRTYENIQNIITGQGDDYTTGCLLDYNYFKKYYKMIAMDFSKQQSLDAESKVVQFCRKSRK